MIFKSILILLLTTLIAVQCKSAAKQKSKPLKTAVTFVIEQQKEGENEVIQFVLEMKQSDPSLLDAMDKARELQLEIRQIYSEFCLKYNERATQEWCENHIDAAEYQIQSEYYQLRGQQLFKTNVIRFEMTFTVIAFKHIGTLIDEFEELMEESLAILKSIKWEDLDQENPQQNIMKRGLERAKSTCKSLGMRFDHIKSVSFVQEEEKEPEKPKPKPSDGQEEESQQEEEEEQQQQDEGDEELERYKFVVVCKSKQPKPKVKVSKKTFNELAKAKAKKLKGNQVSKKASKLDEEL